MKILYITSDSGWGGSSVALFNIIENLCTFNKIVVFLPDKTGTLGQRLNKLGVTCIDSPFGINCYPHLAVSISSLKSIWFFLKSFYYVPKAKAKLEQVIKSFKPDIVHQNVGPLNLSLGICQKYNIPHVWHLREYQELMGMHFFPTTSVFRKSIFSNNNYNIAITNDIFKFYNLRNGIDTVIYDGVIPNGVFAHKCSKEKYFLYVGRIQDVKGVMDILIAFKDFHRLYPEYRLLLAGNWDTSLDFKKKCDEFIAVSQISSCVDFLGQRTDIYKLMSKAQALIVASKFEGFGFISVEAMFNYCYVIGRNTGGIKEQFDKGLEAFGSEIGFRFEDVKGLVHAMTLVVNEYSEEMLNNAKNIVDNNYTSKVCAENILNFYDKILKGR